MFKKFAVNVMLFVVVATAVFAGDSNIVADPTAPGNQRPVVLPTAGGLPQVNINTPNGSGLSYNRYQAFDVGRKGAILNNSNQNVNTQLGGWIEGNPNLVNGSASLIINEVNSARPSSLRGFVEVAGQRADVVIANPSGINVDGGGFINAHRATLTTGKPQIENGALTGYEVRGGQVNVTGSGLNFNDTTFADIVTKSAAINAGVWADQLNVVTGENFVSPDGHTINRLHPDAETGVSLDVGAIGGMYANQIRLVGTGKGVGVNTGIHNQGEIVARVGEVVVNADGSLVSSGLISGKTGFEAALGGSLVQTDGRIQSEGSINVAAGQSIFLDGEVVSLQDTTLDAAIDFTTTGKIQTQENLEVYARSGNMDNSGGIYAGAATTLDAYGNLVNTGRVEGGGNMALTAQTGSITSSGDVLAGGTLDVNAYVDIDNSGSLQSEGALFIEAETGTFKNSGLVATNDTLTLKSGRDMETTGQMFAGKDLHLTTGGSFANSGDLQAGRDANITAQNNFSNDGTIRAQQSININAQTGTFENAGSLATNGAANFTSGHSMINTGDVVVGGDVRSITGGSFSNIDGSIEVGGGMTARARGAFTNTGDMRINEAFSATAAGGHFDNSGLIGTNSRATLTSQDNMTNSGELVAGGDLTAKTGGNFANSNEIQAVGNGSIEAQGRFDNTGSLRVGGDLTVTAKTGGFDNSGYIDSNGTSSMRTAGDFVNSGEVISVGAMGIDAYGNITNTQLVQAGDSLTARAGGSFQSTDRILAGGALSATADTGIFTMSGKMATNSSAGLNSALDMTLDGELYVGSDFSAITGGSFLTSTLIDAGGFGVVRAANDFRNSGTFTSLAGLGVYAANGTFINSGLIGTNSNAVFESGMDMRNTGRMLAGGTMTINSGGQFRNTREMQSVDDMAVTATSNLVNTGSIKSGGSFSAESVTGSFGNDETATIDANGIAWLRSATQMENLGKFRIIGAIDAATGGSFANRDIFHSGGDMSIVADKNFINEGGIESATNLNILARNGSFNNTTLLAANNNAVFTSGDRMINNRGRMLVGGNLTASSGGSYSNSGEMTTTGDLRLSAVGGIRNEGDIESGNAYIKGDSFYNLGLVDGGEIVIQAENTISNVDTGSIFGDHIALEAENILNGTAEAVEGILKTSLVFNKETGKYDLVDPTDPIANDADNFDFTDYENDKHAEFGEDEEFDGIWTWVDESAGDDDIDPEGEEDGEPKEPVYREPTEEEERELDEVVKEEDADYDEDHQVYTYDPGEGKTTSGSVGLIAARERLDVAFAGQLTNREDGLLYSGGDMYIGGVLDGSYHATGTGGKVLNSSAVIDVDRNLTGSVSELVNHNNHYAVEKRLVDQKSYKGYRFSKVGDSKIYIVGIDDIRYGRTKRGASKIIKPYDQEDYFEYNITKRIYDHFITESRPGFITTGGDLTITGNVTNNRSNMVAGGVLTINGDFENIAAKEARITEETGSIYWTYVKSSGTFGKKHKRKHNYAGVYNPGIEFEVVDKDINVFGDLEVSQPKNTNAKIVKVAAGNGIDTDVNLATDARFTSDVSVGTDVKVTTNILVAIDDGATLSLSKLNSNLYSINPSSTSNYLVETNPRLTNYRNWLGSDFMIERLAADPQNVLKRLGDGYYEQRLVRDQMISLTGNRYLDGYKNDEEQYHDLMLAGVEFAEEYGLELGMTLSEDLMARLTSDIVWLEYITVDTPEGPQQVLAPVVYLAPGREILLAADGGIVSGREVNITGQFNNAGNVLGRDSVTIDGFDLNNSGSIAGGFVSMAALRDINNTGGTIIGRDGVDLSAGRDINVVSSTYTSTTENGSRTDITSVGGIYVTGEEGKLALQAGRDINLKAADIDSAGSLEMVAGNNLNIGGVNIALENKTGANNNYLHDKYSSDVGSVISATGDINLSAGQDVDVTGSHVLGDGELRIEAGRDVSVTEGRAEEYHETKSYEKSSGFLSSKTKENHNKDYSNTALGSELSGNTVVIEAGRDFTLRGSTVAASEGLSVEAGSDINIETAENTSESYSRSETKRSGFSGSIGGGSIGVSYGSSKKGSESETASTWNTGSMIGSENGNVDLYAGKDVSISGSQVIAGTGDIDISGENVTISNAYDNNDSKSRDWYEQKGISVSVGVGGAVGQAINSGLSAVNNAGRAQDAMTDRAGALFGIAAARDAYDTGKDIAKVADIAKGGEGQLAGVSVNIGYSSTKSESSQENHDTSVVGSLIQSGGNTTITARGKEGEIGTGDLAIIGSEVHAGGKVVIDAANDIILASASESSDFNSSNSSSSSGFGASIGIGIGKGSGGVTVGVNANAGTSKGSGQGSDVRHIETIIQGDKGVEFTSGKDTTIKGAQVIGEKVTGNVGGDLAIISEQDTFNESRDQSSKGGNISAGLPIGAGSGSLGGSVSSQDQKSKADYASVDEQSGIYAGDGGFDITVGGNTGLTGAVIASTADADNNKLTTGSITVEDIDNSMSYEASTSGWGAEFTYAKNPNKDDKNANTGSISPSLPMKEKGDDKSTTKSAIANGTITITDEDAQLAKTGQTADEAVASLDRDTDNAHDGPLERPPSLEELLAKQAELAEASGLAGKAMAETIGDVCEMMYKKTGDREWLEGGANKLALQAAGAGLIAQLGNGNGLDAALGAIANQLAAKQFADIAEALTAGIEDDDAAKLMSNLVHNSLATIIGQIVGGETGSNAASYMDRYNREMHPEERAKIHEIVINMLEEAGIDYKEDEALFRMLVDYFEDAAAWVLESWAEFPINSQEYNDYLDKALRGKDNLDAIELLKSIGDGMRTIYMHTNGQYSSEFTYFDLSDAEKWSDSNKQWMATHIDTRAIGFVQLTAGATEAVLAAMAIPETWGVSGIFVLHGADHAWAGLKTTIYGDYNKTFMMEIADEYGVPRYISVPADVALSIIGGAVSGAVIKAPSVTAVNGTTGGSVSAGSKLPVIEMVFDDVSNMWIVPPTANLPVVAPGLSIALTNGQKIPVLAGGVLDLTTPVNRIGAASWLQGYLAGKSTAPVQVTLSEASATASEIARLLTDTHTNSMKYGEASTAASLQDLFGKMERVGEGQKGDFLITEGPLKGKTVDLMFTTEGPANTASLNSSFIKNLSKTKEKILNHLEKADIVPLVMKNLDTRNQRLIDNFIRRLPAEDQKKIVIIR